jgi:hypothetical protein
MLARALFFVAAVLMLLDAIGYSIGALRQLQRALAPADAYLRKRLLLNLMLANAGLYFTALIALAGAYLQAVSRYAANLVMAIALLACLYSVVTVAVLTPRDWTHALLRAVAVISIVVGLAVSP